MIVTARRWGGTALALTVALASAVLVLRLPDAFVQSPWNPYVTVLPFGAFVFLVWASWCGDRWSPPFAILVGTFCVQTHVGYAPLVLPLVVWCGWTTISHALGTRGHPHRWRPAVMTALTLGALWLLPVVQQLTHSPGNLGVMVEYFRDATQPLQGFGPGMRGISAQFSLDADWIVGVGKLQANGEPVTLLGRPLPLLVVPFLVAVGVAWRRSRVELRRLGILLGATVVLGVLALARTTGPMFEYRLRWVWLLAAVCAAYTVAVAIDVTRPRGDLRTRLVVGTVALIAAGAGLALWKTASFEPPDLAGSRQVDSLTAQAAREIPAPPRTLRIDLASRSFGTQSGLSGVILRFERRGYDVRVAPTRNYVSIVGPDRASASDGSSDRLVLTSGADIEWVRRTPGATEIAFIGPSTRREVARAVAARRQVRPGSVVPVVGARARGDRARPAGLRDLLGPSERPPRSDVSRPTSCNS